MKTLVIFLVVGLTISSASAALDIGFEAAEGYIDGNIHGQNGWSVDGGSAIVNTIGGGLNGAGGATIYSPDSFIHVTDAGGPITGDAYFTIYYNTAGSDGIQLLAGDGDALDEHAALYLYTRNTGGALNYQDGSAFKSGPTPPETGWWAVRGDLHWDAGTSRYTSWDLRYAQGSDTDWTVIDTGLGFRSQDAGGFNYDLESVLVWNRPAPTVGDRVGPHMFDNVYLGNVEPALIPLEPPPPPPPPPPVVGRQKQLLVDDYVIAATSNVTRKLGTVAKESAPVMMPAAGEYPLQLFAFYSTVLRDEDKFKMWYLATYDPGYDIGYAESLDGINWTRPNVGPDGDNNFVFRAHGFSVSIDPHETDPARKYKACYCPPADEYDLEGGKNVAKCAHLAYSADGIHWTRYNDGKAVIPRTEFPDPETPGETFITAGDTHNQIIWDPDAEVYRLFTRDLYLDGADKVSRGTRSMINPDVNADPTDWTMVRSWEFDREGPDEYLDRQVYALTDWIYEGVHFAQISLFRQDSGLIDYYIATSRDGDSWDLDWVYAEQPLIPPGPEGSFDAAGAAPFSQVVTYEGKHWLYYAAMDKGHKDAANESSIGLATLRLDGFVALSAGDEPGTVTTIPFLLEGCELEINVDASAAGSQFFLEILDADGEPIPGFGKDDFTTVEGLDQLRFRPQWENADLAALKGEEIQLKFYLQNAELYAFQVLSVPGDANNDGVVDEADAAILAANWLMQDTAAWGDGDFNNDGNVDDVDAALMAANWHVGAAAKVSVPEPMPLVILSPLMLFGWLALKKKERVRKSLTL